MTRMNRTGNTVADEEQAPVTHGTAQVDPHDGDHGVTIRRTRAMASPPVTTAMRQKDEERADHRRRRLPEQRQASEPDQRPAVGGGEAEHLQGLGERSRREQVAPQQCQHQPDHQRGGEGLLRGAGERGEEGPEPAHGRRGAHAQHQHAERGRPSRHRRRRPSRPQTIRMEASPVSADGEQLAPHDGARADAAPPPAGPGFPSPLHQERAHPEPAPDEEEDDRGGNQSYSWAINRSDATLNFSWYNSAGTQYSAASTGAVSMANWWCLTLFGTPRITGSISMKTGLIRLRELRRALVR